MRGSRTVLRFTLLALCILVGTAAWAGPERQGEKAEAGWLGVSIQDVTRDIRDALPRGVQEGVIVSNVVAASPAEEAGLEKGDVITRFNRAVIRKADDLTRAVREAGAGSTVDIEFYRDGRRMRERVTLGEVGETPAVKSYRKQLTWDKRDSDDDEDDDSQVWLFGEDTPALSMFIRGGDRGRLGVQLMEMGEQLAAYFQVEEDDGPLVTGVVKDSPAEAAGIRAGDVITHLDGEPVEDAEDIRRILRRFDEGGTVDVQIVRGGRSQTLSAALEENEQDFSYRIMPHFERFRVGPRDSKWFEDLPEFHRDRRALEEQMKELRKELDEMRRELSELRSRRP